MIVLARGGGSLEDLAAFNSERVARAIASSRLPVVSAVGHETDFTIADFVADLRAPTPSAAAELITEAQHKIAEHLAQQAHRLERAARFQLLQARQRLTRLPVSRAEGRVAAQLLRSCAAAGRSEPCGLKLRSRASCGNAQRQVAELAAAVLRHDPRQALAQARERLAGIAARAWTGRWSEPCAARQCARARWMRGCIALSPLAVLDRGYALVLDDEAGWCARRRRWRRAISVTTRLADGAFTSRVESTRRKREKVSVEDRKRRNETMSDRPATRKLFGTDGIRGIAGEAPLDATTIFATGLALAHSLRREAAEPA